MAYIQLSKELRDLGVTSGHCSAENRADAEKLMKLAETQLRISDEHRQELLRLTQEFQNRDYQ
jgi:hypothetical protein